MFLYLEVLMEAGESSTFQPGSTGGPPFICVFRDIRAFISLFWALEMIGVVYGWRPIWLVGRSPFLVEKYESVG